jgi:hypothetical protein
VCRPIPSVAPVIRKLLDLRDDDVDDMDMLDENREAAVTAHCNILYLLGVREIHLSSHPESRPK